MLLELFGVACTASTSAVSLDELPWKTRRGHWHDVQE